jgi:mannose-1-phosphate guanylyltransferase/phosphomannomutase
MMRKFLEASRGKRNSTVDGVKIWENETDWILMIPDMYGDYLNLYLQAADEAAGQALQSDYEASIKAWMSEK